MRRADWDKVLGWCATLGEPTLARRHDLRGVQVRSLLMSRRQDDLEELVRRMRRPASSTGCWWRRPTWRRGGVGLHIGDCRGCSP